METNIVAFKSDEVIKILRTAPEILQKNEMSILNCTKAGNSLLQTIESQNGINSDEMDAQVQSFLEKTKVTVDNMNARRKPLTQMLTEISRRFTQLEGSIDVKSSGTIPSRLKAERDRYAKKKFEEAKRIEEEARRKKAIETERAQFNADVAFDLDNAYAAYVENSLNGLSNIYSNATLSNFIDVVKLIKEYDDKFELKTYLIYVKFTTIPVYLLEEEVKKIKNDVLLEKKYSFINRYSFEINEMKQSLIDRLPSLKKQLEEQEELRKTNIEEAQRLAAIKKQREEEERKKIEEERKRKEAEFKAAADAAKAAAEVQAAFEYNALTAANSPKAKVKKKIQIMNPQGYLSIYQMWFSQEGINLPADELEKIHKKMISFCEKAVNKDGEMIQSAFVKYVDDVTAK